MAGHIPDSLSVDWCTQDSIVEGVHKALGGPPALDPCSNPHSRVGALVSYTLERGNDGLIDPWNAPTTFVNPPFGKGWYKARPDGRRDYMWPAERAALVSNTGPFTGLSKAEVKKILAEYTPVSIADWIKKCAEVGHHEEADSPRVIGLIPAYPGTKAWQQDVWPRARAVFFPKGRLHFRLVYAQPDGSTVEKTGPAPMDCAMPYWGPTGGLQAFVDAFRKMGHVVVRV